MKTDHNFKRFFFPCKREINKIYGVSWRGLQGQRTSEVLFFSLVWFYFMRVRVDFSRTCMQANGDEMAQQEALMIYERESIS